MTREEVTIAISDILSELEKIIIGKRQVLEHALSAMLSGGHLLLEDVPGVGKTVLAKAFGLVSSVCSLLLTLCPRISRERLFIIREQVLLSFSPALSLPISCWRMRLTVPVPRLSPVCWNAWRNGRYRLKAELIL